MTTQAPKKVILITGASSGIGLASALRLIAAGHTVYASARTESAERNIAKAGGRPVRIEMTDETSIRNTVQEIMQREKRIDVLFNNAGWGHYGPVEEVPLSIARHTFEVNLFGLARLTQLVVPHLRAQKSGTIINTSSIGGKIYTPLGAWYHASKHALEGWSDCLRLELAPFGIHVVIVEPGIIDTGFNEAMVGRISELDSSGAYEETKQALVGVSRSDTHDAGSPPSVIADIVERIVNTPRPRTRYHAGRLSRLVLFVRRYFSDRFFDRFVMHQVNRVITGSRRGR